MIIPKIMTIDSKQMVGMRLQMSLIDNKTGDLFRKFMPRKKEIRNVISDGVYALQQYDFKTFTPQTVFEKWACVETKDPINIPIEMETFTLSGGLYAIFIHKGTTQDFVKSMGYITQVWLPDSLYKMDHSRPHFEYLSEKYLGPNNPLSEEEIWIPISLQ